MGKSNTQRQREFQERQRQAGYERLTVWATPDQAEAIKKFLKEEDPSSGQRHMKNKPADGHKQLICWLDSKDQEALDQIAEDLQVTYNEAILAAIYYTLEDASE